uniref:Uncharacterized protein n=1 Tax=Oryzias latipes TaxID=8090 RepID=A0A3P9MLF3_ORYLA
MSFIISEVPWLQIFISELRKALRRGEKSSIINLSFPHLVPEKTVGIYVVKHDSSNKPEDIGIHWLLLNLNYPPGIKNTWEGLQKLVMELECGTVSKKVQSSIYVFLKLNLMF